ncbi:hypothetical protein [Bacillus alkalisoli]|uniref:hypothetical protein n=1 Tax=Bacillus alkalisoli TaxID=2011008 RepID=UPI0018E2231A|nr:hypothetical protein [Bacillus alkalisoli]
MKFNQLPKKDADELHQYIKKEDRTKPMNLNGKGARKNKKVVLAGTFALTATSLKTN